MHRNFECLMDNEESCFCMYKFSFCCRAVKLVSSLNMKHLASEDFIKNFTWCVCRFPSLQVFVVKVFYDNVYVYLHLLTSVAISEYSWQVISIRASVID